MISGSMSTTARRASGSVMPSSLILFSTRASICQTTIRSVIWPIERVSEMAVSSLSTPRRTRSIMVPIAAVSCGVKARSPSRTFGKPRARQSLRAEISETPSSPAISRRVSVR